MRLLKIWKWGAVLLGGFAGLSCLTNLQAQDQYLNPEATFNTTHCDVPGRVSQAGPTLFFQVDYLFWTRDSNFSGGSVVGGPDAFGYNDLDFSFQSGYRLKTAIAGENYELEFVWSQIDGWNETANGQLTNGVSFDQGIGTTFAGANFINGGTHFQPIFNAASANLTATAGPNEQLEHEGFGPVGAFADAAATYQMQYRSNLKDWELMAKFAPLNGRFKLGAGWRHVNLDELSSISLMGTFRAVNNGAGANGGLSHTALTDPNGGNLTLLSGAGDGFDDETALLGGAGPDTLLFQNGATTDNSLNGLQFSLEGLLLERESFLFDGFIKVGAYNNQARGTITETYAGIANDNSVYGRSFASSQNSVAFVGQAGLGTVFRLTDNIRLRGGWEVLFLSGVAIAPEQAAAVIGSTYNVENDGSMIANGGNIGLEFVY
ncbi:MAG: hypothetical protein JKY95_14075 [Planctomycetaceae bacterium]|nr:hypothetical protein [Planctomycetaceae bacterium]